MSLNNCAVEDNAAINGGGIYNAGTLNVTNCTISQNSAVMGGALYNQYDGSVIIDSNSVTFSGNTASNSGDDVLAEQGNVLFATDYLFLPTITK